MWIASQSPWHLRHSLILPYFMAPVCQINPPLWESCSHDIPIPLRIEACAQPLASCKPSGCSRQLGRYEM